MQIRIAFATAVLLAFSAPLCQAQTATQGDSSFVGTTKAKVGCPVMKLHILRSDSNLSGVVFYADGSGVSTVKGTTDGKKFSYTLTPVSGHGPTGEVVGTVSADGMIMSHNVGTSCGFAATIPRYADVLDHGG